MKSFKINTSRLDKPDKDAFLAGTISIDDEERFFFMSCRKGATSIWNFFVRREDGKYVQPKFFPKLVRPDYPVKFSGWLMDNMDRIIRAADDNDEDDEKNIVTIDYTKDLISQVSRDHRIEGLITRGSDVCSFSLTSYAQGTWTLFISKAHSNISIGYNVMPNFSYSTLYNGILIKWIGEHAQDLIDFSNTNWTRD